MLKKKGSFNKDDKTPIFNSNLFSKGSIISGDKVPILLFKDIKFYINCK